MALIDKLSAIGDAIREMTGGTEQLTLDAMPGEIRGISGGSSKDLRYVTFMSHDGTVELGKKAVAVGDDCADPIARGIFATPTRESTAQYNYTFAGGWATEPNGALDSTAFDAVTEDRTLYATYISTVRYYTIKYYDADGTTLLHSESLAYGSKPSYVPEKSGFSFEAWSPAVVNVTGDASYVAQWEEKTTFAGGAWEDIIAIAERGEAKDYFAIGDKKTIQVGTKSIDLYIIGFDHDTLADRTGKASMTIGAAGVMDNTTAISNWSTLASFMKNTLKPQLPSDLQAGIKPVIKECDGTATNTEITPSNVTFDLFPLSLDELCVKAHYKRRSTDSDWRTMFTELGTPYEYFVNNYSSSYFGPYATLGAYWSGINGSWLRQYIRASSGQGAYVKRYAGSGSYGYCDAASATTAKTVMFAFCI